MNAKLRKSVRTYRDMLASADFWQQRKRREIHVYLRSLYDEFGRANVRAEIERQKL